MEARPRALAAARRRGNQIWTYTALVQDGYSPKWELDFAPMNYRITAGFGGAATGIDGLLYWSVDYWQHDPWTNVDYFEAGHYPGEALLIYPGADVGVRGPVPSMRLSWIRLGVEDYEYVHILRARGLGAEAMRIVAPAATDWRHWSQDPSVTESVRAQLAAAIVSSNPNAELQRLAR
jgi:hypothetical protein